MYTYIYIDITDADCAIAIGVSVTSSSRPTFSAGVLQATKRKKPLVNY